MGERLKPYKDVIIFMITLLVANYLWKFTMNGDENGDAVTWFGLDITAPFAFMSTHIAHVVYNMLALIRDVHMVGENTIRFESGSGTTIIWACSGLKQAFIWMCLILTVPQSTINNQQSKIRRLWLHKLWYIPAGWVACHAFNILRIFLICLFIEHHPDWFHLLHDYIFKYLFYAMMFGLWVIFVEKIRQPSSSH